MTEVSAATAGMDMFSATAASMAAEIVGSAAAAVATGPAVLTPVFGLIGTEFLAAFTGVHTAHTTAMTTLAGTAASVGVAASASAAGYDATDVSTAASLA